MNATLQLIDELSLSAETDILASRQPFDLAFEFGTVGVAVLEVDGEKGDRGGLVGQLAVEGGGELDLGIVRRRGGEDRGDRRRP